MSDWRSVREKQSTGMRFRKEIQFGEEEIDDDDDEEIHQTSTATGDSDNGHSLEETELDEATLKSLERKANFRASMKRGIMFGASAGSMVGGMVGVYDAFRTTGNSKFEMTRSMKNLTRSVPGGIISMAGWFILYQGVKVGSTYARSKSDFYNNLFGCVIGFLPFVKMQFMRRYYFYPLIMMGLDMWSDWKERKNIVN